MDTSNHSQRQEITLRGLYPHLSEEELQIAAENFDRYLELAVRMYDRIRQDPEEYARFKTLTGRTADHYDGGGKVDY
jgi:hypothetical protein